MRAAAPRRSLAAAAALAIVLFFIFWHGPRALHFVFPSREASAEAAPQSAVVRARTAATADGFESPQPTSDFRDALADAPIQSHRQEPPRALEAPSSANSWWVVNFLPSGKRRISRVDDAGLRTLKRAPFFSKPASAVAPKTWPLIAKPAHERIKTPSTVARAPVLRHAPSSSDKPAMPAFNKTSRGEDSAALPPAAESASSREPAQFDDEDSPRGRASRSAPARRRRGRATRPEALARLLGKGALRPPKGPFQPPDFSALERQLPLAGAPASLAEIEASIPSKREPAGKLRLAEGTLAWIKPHGAQQWIKASPTAPELLRHDEHWWWQREGIWFVIHDGQPWGLRYFDEWRREGLVNPASGTQILYSADASKAAVLTPGQGAVLFDVKTGQELASWSEAQLPHRKSPKLPNAAGAFGAD